MIDRNNPCLRNDLGNDMTDSLDKFIHILNDVNASPVEIERSINSLIDLRLENNQKKDQLIIDREDILIEGSKSAIDNNDRERDETNAQIERMSAIESKLRIKLDRALETVRETDIQNKRELLIKERESAADQFKDIYRKNAIAIAAAVAKVALADAKISKFNKDNDELMDSCDAIARNFRLLPQEIINETIIENALVDPMTEAPVDPTKYKLISQDNPRSAVYSGLNGAGFPQTLLIRNVKKIDYKEKVEMIEQPISKLLSLPPAYAGDEPLWSTTSRERIDKLSVEELEILADKFAKAASAGREKKSMAIMDDREIKTKYVIMD